MALQQNLTEENLDDLKRTFKEKIAPTNPAATFQSFPMSDSDRQILLEENVASLELQVSDLTRYIKSVFDGHILLDGLKCEVCNGINIHKATCSAGFGAIIPPTT